jgi:site-specific DNA-methyltransferase (adenine-specific)
VLPYLPKVDLVLTDPPYGVGIDYGDLQVDSFDAWKRLMEFLLPTAINKSRGAFLVSTSKIEGEAFLFANYPPLWRICWFKGASCTRSPIGFKDWETIFVYGKPRGGQFHDYFHANANNTRNDIKGHPCPKPIKWGKWLIDKCSIPGDIILDPFLGSGTTAVAAKILGRKCIGIEIEEKYCEIAAERLAQEVLAL